MKEMSGDGRGAVQGSKARHPSIPTKVGIHLLACLILIGAWVGEASGQEWSRDIQLTFPPDTGGSAVTSHYMICDRNGNKHILYSIALDRSLSEDWARLYYLRLDSIGRELDRVELSDTLAGYIRISGILDLTGNVHFFWYHYNPISGDGAVNYLRVSPEGRLLDGPRELTKNGSTAPIVVVRRDGTIFAGMVSDSNAVVRGLSTDGIWADDSLVVEGVFRGKRQDGFTVDARNIAHIFTGISTGINNVYIAYTAVRLNGEVLYRDYPITPITNGNNSSIISKIEVDRSDNLLMSYTRNEQFWLRKFSTPEDTIWDRPLVERGAPNYPGQFEAKLDSSENLHYCFELDTIDTNTNQRFHLTYGVIGPNGEDVVQPYWIGSDRRDVQQTAVLHVIPQSLERVSVTAVITLTHRPRIQKHLFIKILHYPSESVKDDPFLVMSSTDLQIYPNPTNGFVTLQLHAIPNNAALSIFDSAGREVFNRRNITTGVIQWNPEGIATGSYFVSVRGGGKVFSRRLVLGK